MNNSPYLKFLPTPAFKIDTYPSIIKMECYKASLILKPILALTPPLEKLKSKDFPWFQHLE
jgi:hypothetical protein